MNRLASRVRGPGGPGAHLELGVGQHVLVGPLHLLGLDVPGFYSFRLVQEPGPSEQVLHVHVVERGQASQHAGAGTAVAPFNLGEVGVGDARASAHLPEPGLSP